jgi:hypothetical protein
MQESWRDKAEREGLLRVATVLAVHPKVWCEAVTTGRGTIVGYRIRDRDGRFFGFGDVRRAAWDDAWRRIQEGGPD